MSHEITILTEAGLRDLMTLDLATVEVVQGAFEALSRGGVVMPPILSMQLEDREAEVDVKTAYIPGLPGFALKVSTGFFGNAALGLPSLGGLMTVFSAVTGRVEAVLLDNGFLTDLRTAAAGAVAARALAPGRVETAAVLGAGLQARLQIEAAHLVRPFGRVLVWGRDAQKARACADDIAERLGIVADTVEDPARAVAEAQLVVTTTPAREPILRADWLHPGLHVTAMGSDMALKQELEARVVAEADLYVPDRLSQCERLGEFRAVREAGLWGGRADPPELGDVLLGRAAGRTADSDVTIADLTGTGAQDTVIATHALARAREAGAGSVISA